MATKNKRLAKTNEYAKTLIHATIEAYTIYS